MMVLSAPILQSLLWTDQRLFQRRRLEGERDEEMRQLLLAMKSEYVVVQNSAKFDKSFCTVIEYAAMQRKCGKN